MATALKRRAPWVALLAVAATLAWSEAASADVTIGQTGNPQSTTCNSPFDYVDPVVTSVNSYRVPNIPGTPSQTVTSWTTFGGSFMG